MSPKDILMTGTDLSIFDHPELGKADLDFRALQRSLESRLPTRDGFENIHPIDTSGNFFYTQKFDPNQRHAVLCWSLISREALSIELGLVGDEARVPLALIREPKWGAGTYCPIPSGKIDPIDYTDFLVTTISNAAVREFGEEMAGERREQKRSIGSVAHIRPHPVASFRESRSGYFVHTCVSAIQGLHNPVNVDPREYEAWKMMKFGELSAHIDDPGCPFDIGVLTSLSQCYGYLAGLQESFAATDRLLPRQSS
jgi:hypothetical protein